MADFVPLQRRTQYWYLIPIAVLAIPAICALIPMIATGLTLRSSFKHQGQKIIYFSLIWLTLEWIRGHYIFGGFPWLMLSDIWINYLPFAQLYAVVGPYGLTLVTLLIILGCACCTSWQQRSVVVVLLGVWFMGGIVRLQHPVTLNPAYQVALIQPNVKQVNKWQPHLLDQHIERLTAATDIQCHATQPTIFIFPESAIAYRLNQQPQLCGYLTQYLQKEDILLTGSTRNDEVSSKQIYNSLYMLNSQGNIIDSYDKVHLTPFGEYIPLRVLFPNLVDTLMGQQIDFSFGDRHKILTPTQHLTVLPLICYEGIFCDEIDPHQEFDWIVNVTNDGWFLNSSGPQQHFAMIRACAIAWGVPIVRVANTGVSGIIDGYGRIVQQLDYDQRGVIVGQVPYKLLHKTLFARYGNKLFFMIYLSLALILIRMLTRTKLKNLVLRIFKRVNL